MYTVAGCACACKYVHNNHQCVGDNCQCARIKSCGVRLLFFFTSHSCIKFSSRFGLSFSRKLRMFLSIKKLHVEVMNLDPKIS